MEKEKNTPVESVKLKNDFTIDEGKSLVKGGFVGLNDFDLDTSNLTEEEKQKAVENIRHQARKMLRQALNTQFLQVYAKIKKGQTLQDIIKEVEEKKSDMTRSAREFVTNFKEEVIQEWIDDIEGRNTTPRNASPVEDVEIVEETKNTEEEPKNE